MSHTSTTLILLHLRVLRPRPGVVVMCLLAAVAFFHRSAHAETCGHYLFKNGQPVASSHHLPHAEAIAAATRHQQQLPVFPQVPCNGPGCRKQSIPLVPPPAAPASVTASDPAALLNDLLSADSCADGVASPQSERGEHWFAGEVFRPPTA